MGTGTVGYELVLSTRVLAANGLIGAGLLAAPMVVKPLGWVAPIFAILVAHVVILAGRRRLGAIRPRVSGPVMG